MSGVWSTLSSLLRSSDDNSSMSANMATDKEANKHSTTKADEKMPAKDAVVVADSRFKMRKVQPSDFEAIEKLTQEQHFDIGLPNIQLFYGVCPDGWECIEDTQTGELVAYESNNFLQNGVGFGHSILVNENFRGFGLTKFFTNFRRGKVNMGNATRYSIQRMKPIPIWQLRLVGFYGLPNRRRFLKHVSWNPAATSDVKIEKMTVAHIPSVLMFDEQIVKLKRDAFLGEWLLPRDTQLSRSFTAVTSAGKTVGYVSMRKTTFYWTLAPLYAENHELAKALLAAVISTLDCGEYIYVKFAASNKTMLAFVNFTMLMQTETEMQWCDSIAKNYLNSLDYSKIYALHEFWPV